MLFQRVERINPDEVKKVLSASKETYKVFPLVSPTSEGGKYLMSTEFYDDFNVASDSLFDIYYCKKESRWNHNDYKQNLIEAISKVQPNKNVRPKFVYSGFFIFSPKLDKIYFWKMKIENNTPSKIEVYKELRNLSNVLKSNFRIKSGINSLGRVTAELEDWASHPEKVCAFLADFISKYLTECSS